MNTFKEKLVYIIETTVIVYKIESCKKLKKPKALKKREQEQRQSFDKLRSIVRSFSTEQWLELIRTLDIRETALKGVNPVSADISKTV